MNTSTARQIVLAARPNGKPRLTDVDGLERAPEAFIGMLDGRNFGKVIVRVRA